MMKKIVLVSAAALVLAACGNADESSADLPGKAGTAIDEQALAEAVGSAIDQEAVAAIVRGAANDAVRQAVREALPAEEIALVGAVVDEEALAAGIDRAVDGEALAGVLKGAIRGAAEEPRPAQ
ncbi:hypothetical protein [Altericroceibacterium xinjiangense]|uniref:hypothetical protein n=1 Tax=Altericroceibacterium xinjiangense TaxID=762261 RepID=UPI000F7F33A5|nr:hypothetical protein [Altericroceibacterium xinjiangense]